MRILRLSVFVTLLMACSCQHTGDDLMTQNTADTISADSPLAQLILRVSQNAVSYDNVLDSSDCFSIKLPVNITVDGQSMTMMDESNFESVRDIMDGSGTDDDLVHFAYPITVVYLDFTEITVNSYQQFEALSQNCDDDGFHEIRCIGFNFPLRINTYNTDSQVAGSFEINDNAHLFSFLQNASAESLVGIAFPITVSTAGGDLVINSNAELENAIEDSIGTCDDDDTGSGPSTLTDIITDGNWHVSYCQGPGDAYGGYGFSFLSGGTVDVVRNGIHSAGNWNLYPDDDDEMLYLNFIENGLHSIEGDWRIIEYNESEIRLKKDHGGSGGGPGGRGKDEEDYLYFTKN